MKKLDRVAAVGIILLLIVALFVPIALSGPDKVKSTQVPFEHSWNHDFRQYTGKTVLRVQNMNRYDVQITFTDGTSLYLKANKYAIDVR